MPPTSKTAYGEDLAYIHDVGFGSFARHASRWLISRLKQQGIRSGRIVELGCGSGISAAAFIDAGYDVVGFDISPAMIELARQHAPRGDFHQASFLDAELPPCIAVTSIGEVFNYLFDRHNSQAQLLRLFRRVYRSLQPGGLFLFDGAEPGRVGKHRRRYGVEGTDWACLVDVDEDAKTGIVTRRITSFRRVGQLYSREHEVHRLRLFDRQRLMTELRKLGFRVSTLRGYGDLKFPRGYVGISAAKPIR
jgi:SAM-dependent methyltransferase